VASTATANRYVTLPSGIAGQIPEGALLDVLLAEVRQGILACAPDQVLRVAPFDLPWTEAACAVVLEDQGFSESAAWWLAREASLTEIIEAVP
jgi:hypothetical protein